MAPEGRAVSAPRVRHEKRAVRERAAREHAELDALARRLTPEDWRLLVPRPAGKELWTVKDAFAHVVFWKWHTARMIRGERLPEPLRGLTYTQQNSMVYEDWKDEPVEALLAWHERVQSEVLSSIDGRDEAWFSGRLRSPFWPGDLESHSAEHRHGDIEAALVQSGRWSAASGSELLSTSA